MRGHSVPWLSGLEKRQERFLVFGSQPCFWLREEKSTNGSHRIGLQQLSQHFGNKSSHYLNNVKTVFPDQLLFETFGGWWGEELISSSLSWCPFSAFSSCSMRMPDMLAAHLVICVLRATEGGRLSLVSPQTWEWQCPGSNEQENLLSRIVNGKALEFTEKSRSVLGEFEGQRCLFCFQEYLTLQ